MADDTATRHWESLTPILGKYFLVAFVGWTVVVAAFLIRDVNVTRGFVLKDARTDALANYNKDVAFREWATAHGGVYVPVDETTQPNPYLSNVPERDLITPSGKRLTLMNPAYMARQMNEFFAQKGTVFGHITSLKLKNPNNKADKWEEDALRAFEKGEEERIEVSDVGGKPFLRLMRPILTKAGCLKCHADQGYKVGDIRGGVSVSVGLEPYFADARALTREHAIVSGLVWLIGSLGLLMGYGYARRLGRARDEAREGLVESEERYRQIFRGSKAIKLLIDPATGKLVDANEAACRFYGYTKDELQSKTIYEINTLPPAEINTVMEVVKAEKRDYFNFRHRLSSGEERDVEVYSSPLTVGGKTMLHSIIHDVTERKKAERLLNCRAELSALFATASVDELIQSGLDAAEHFTSSTIGFFHVVDDDQENLSLRT